LIFLLAFWAEIIPKMLMFQGKKRRGDLNPIHPFGGLTQTPATQDDPGQRLLAILISASGKNAKTQPEQIQSAILR
jgi:hypothetical protein